MGPRTRRRCARWGARWDVRWGVRWGVLALASSAWVPLVRGSPELGAPSAAAQEVVAADAAPARFERAVEAYRKGDWARAAAEWRSLYADAPADLDMAGVAFDLGNAAFRLGQPLEAAGWYTASARLRPRAQATWANLELARERARLEPADRGDLVDTAWRLAHALTLAESEWLVVLSALALAAALAWSARTSSSAARRAAWPCAAVCAAAVALWAWRARESSRDAWFVVASGGVELKSEPNAAAASIARADAGSVVARLDAYPGWLRVAAPNGARGWLPDGDVLRLAPGRAAGDASASLGH